MRIVVLFILVFFVSVNGVAMEVPDIKGLSSAVEVGGLSNLMRFAQSNRMLPPAIPSKWHLEHRIKTPDEQRLAEATREFGFLLVESLEREERVQRETPADDRLYAQTERLLDFADWCLKTPGWGNAVLVNRARTLAAIASMRLTVNTNFPIVKCEQIVSRLSEDPLGPKARAAAMNAEARTNLFNLAEVDSDEELDMACGVGWSLDKTAPEGWRIPSCRSLNIEIAKNNLDFFADAPYSPNWESPRASWAYRLFPNFRNGFEWNIFRKAEGVLVFRKEIGCFPRKFVMTTAERESLEKEIRLYAKHGMKITPPEADPSFDALKEAFRRAWYESQNRMLKDCKGYVWALEAYRRVISGAYSPLDKREEE